MHYFAVSSTYLPIRILSQLLVFFCEFPYLQEQHIFYMPQLFIHLTMLDPHKD